MFLSRSSRADGIGEKHVFRIQGLGEEVTGLAWKTSDLRSWHWSTRTAGGAEF